MFADIEMYVFYNLKLTWELTYVSYLRLLATRSRRHDEVVHLVIRKVPQYAGKRCYRSSSLR